MPELQLGLGDEGAPARREGGEYFAPREEGSSRACKAQVLVAYWFSANGGTVVASANQDTHAGLKAWIFQFNDDDDSRKWRKKASPGMNLEWGARQHWRDLGKGDLVFFWQSGDDGGLCGWGEIETGEVTGLAKDRVISVVFGGWLESPVPRKLVIAKGGILPGNRLLTVRVGTNFPVSVREAENLAGILPSSVPRPEARGLVEHPPPESSDPVEAALTRLKISRVTPDAKQALHLAANFGVEQGGRAAITSSRLLFAIEQIGRESNVALAATALAGVLSGDERFASTFRSFRSSYFAPKEAPADSAKGAYLSRNIRAVLQRADVLERDRLKHDALSCDGLLLALLCQNRSSAMRRLDEAGIKVDALASAMGSYFPDASYGQLWTDVLQSALPPPSPGPDPGAVPDEPLEDDGSYTIATMRPDLVSDDPRPDDRLGLRRFADAIGALIAAEQQEPPLSIAVFGPWGSGKSFFMKMVRASVGEFSASGAKSADGKLLFKQRIVSIWFNAWHYVEGNLWASLVHAILVGLQKELSPQAQHSTFEKMLENLGLHEAAQLAAEDELRLAETRLAEAKAAFDQAKIEADERRQKQDGIPDGQTIIGEVWNMTLDAIRPQDKAMNPDAWIKNVSDGAAQAAVYLGREDLLEPIRATKDGALTLQQRVGAMEELLDEVRARPRAS